MTDENGFGPYRLGTLLGRGGMGEVYRAYDTVRGREVALKLLRAQFAEDGTYQERFRRESQTAARLGEPHIVPIHDFGEIDGVLYLDMRLVEGHDLRAVLRGSGPMAPAAAVSVIEQVAAALDAAHAVGLVHRDVKPENILVTDSGFAYLADFGIAHHVGDPRLTHTGTAPGSIAYMAPERLDDGPVGPASDIYSLAAVLFELLTGRQPYPGDSVSAVVKATVLAPVPSPSVISPAVNDALGAVVVRGLAKEPGGRWSTAGEFAAQARAALENPQAGPAYAQTMIGHRPGTRQMPGPQPMGYSQPAGYSQPSGYAQPQWYASGPVRPPQEDRNTLNIVLGAVVGLLLAAVIGLAVYWFGFRESGEQMASGPPLSTATVVETVQPSPTSADPTPPPGTSECGGGVGVATSVTSCEFAANVGAEYLRSGPRGEPRDIVASSPVTGQSYSMSCAPETGVVVCRGGNNAVVVVF